MLGYTGVIWITKMKLLFGNRAVGKKNQSGETRVFSAMLSNKRTIFLRKKERKKERN
jgi:hypothetical protein